MRLGQNIKINLQHLLETRLLVQSNSGGGKSWLLRRLLEVTHGHVQQIVLDMEGEFSTLREKFDYVLAGKGGDIPAEPKSAEILARKILELRANLIVDLYELKKHERIRFVRLFLEAIVNAPKELWHPCLIVIDEAHVFVPEKGESEAAGAVIDLATRGRKRGYCSVLATQRLSKLHKDAAAECLNKLIGRTGLDIDRKRASEELGFTSHEQNLSLRDLEAGEFFAFGPAISKAVIKGKVDAVETTHPKAGQRFKTQVTIPTSKVKSILLKLTDLPKEAEAELKDKQAMMAKIRDLERALRTAPQIKTELRIDEKAMQKQLEHEMKLLKNQISEAVGAVLKIPSNGSGNGSQEKAKTFTRQAYVNAKKIIEANSHPQIEAKIKSIETDEFLKIGRCERAILQFLALRPGVEYTKIQVGAMTGYAGNSGSFNTSISKLSTAGLVARKGEKITICEPGLSVVRSDLANAIAMHDTRTALEAWLQKLGRCERAIYSALLDSPTEIFSKIHLGEMTGYEGASGSFNTALSKLSTLGLVQRNSDGTVQLNQEIIGL